MSTIRWGIIGCGNVTEVKSGPGFQKADNSQLVAVMRRDAALAEDYAARHGVPKWYSDAKQLIEDPEVDAVYVATPPSSHKEYVLQVAQAGKPVYVEKPMAMNYAECQDMIEACEKAGVPLFVAYYRRALPRFVKVKELLASEVIGEVRFVASTQLGRLVNNSSWRVDPVVSGGGLFVDVGSHTLDLLDYLFGPVAEVHGMAGNQGRFYKAEDIVTATYRFESGVYGTGTWCFASSQDLDRNEIVGSKGSISFSTFQDKPIVVTSAQGVEEIMIDHPAHVQQPLIQTVVNELLGKGTSPSSGLSGARTSKVMDTLLRGYYGT
ncbi:Gfo/Idh/MocA family protein [Paenibacillus thalictri]|uniref:Gfo/Idh/MocA family oxidoreductase n=1 Tax=Paenibacillus thalictri TaxID=2527873 RepID=A0A4Q9DNM0_9BACL|nr:Gfo/Idh/MocA family oxidoreductase [Paenibacillus thalictri]TBL75145.1 Gfo/Idh/MocA family oxidoreductase [Paenibacillus thalictri]